MRNTRPIELRIWMLRQGIQQASIARELGVSKNSVHKWINGSMTSSKITDFFDRIGCPRELMHKTGKQKGEKDGTCQDRKQERRTAEV